MRDHEPPMALQKQSRMLPGEDCPDCAHCGAGLHEARPKLVNVLDAVIWCEAVPAPPMANPTPEQTLVGYTLADLRAHLEARFVDGMSWENIGAWHVDHRRPLASFDISGPDCPEFKAAWALSNLQPLWARDNLIKGAKWTP